VAGRSLVANCIHVNCYAVRRIRLRYSIKVRFKLLGSGELSGKRVVCTRVTKALMARGSGRANTSVLVSRASASSFDWTVACDV